MIVDNFLSKSLHMLWTNCIYKYIFHLKSLDINLMKLLILFVLLHVYKFF